MVFAGFALYIWWRMVADDYRRGLEGDDGYDDDEEPGGEPGPNQQTTEPKNSEPEQKVQP